MTHPIAAVLENAVAGGAAPGMVGAARLTSGEIVSAAAGVRRLGQPAKMSTDTVFWIASLTKAITTAAALQLVEAGKLRLDDPVARWLPGLAAPKVLAGFAADGAPVLDDAGAPITLRHLLTHTSGLGYEAFHAGLTRCAAARGADARDIVLAFEPGSDWTYGTGLDWAGQLVEAVSGQPFADYLAERIFNPLTMSETSFAPGAAQSDRRAGMHARLADGALAPREFATPPPPNPGMGGGGLFSTAEDYLRFLTAIIGGGAPILENRTVAKMAQSAWEGSTVGVLPAVNRELTGHFDPFPGMSKQWGLGFLINPATGPNGRSPGSLTWAGLANCYYWADPRTGVIGVMLAQVLPFADERVLRAFGDFERAVYGLQS